MKKSVAYLAALFLFVSKFTGKKCLNNLNISKFQITIWTSLTVVFILSSLDLAAWIFDITTLKSIEPQWIQMKVITAVCFIFSATAIFFIYAGFHSRLKIPLVQVLNASVCIVSLITIIYLGYIKITGLKDTIANIPVLNLFLLPANRMSLMSATIFLLIGCILLLLSLENETTDNIAHVLSFPASLISYFVSVSYILNIYS
jgi:hypothetical protein